MKRWYQLIQQVNKLNRKLQHYILEGDRKEASRFTSLIRRLPQIPQINRKVSGFTLLELSVVLLVLGIIFAGSLMPFGTVMRINQAKEMDEESRTVMDSLYGYAILYGKLPCPSHDENDAVGDCSKLDGYFPYQVLGVSRKFTTLYSVDERFIKKIPALPTMDSEGFPLFPLTFTMISPAGVKRNYSMSFYTLKKRVN